MELKQTTSFKPNVAGDSPIPTRSQDPIRHLLSEKPAQEATMSSLLTFDAKGSVVFTTGRTERKMLLYARVNGCGGV